MIVVTKIRYRHVGITNIKILQNIRIFNFVDYSFELMIIYDRWILIFEILEDKPRKAIIKNIS